MLIVLLVLWLMLVLLLPSHILLYNNNIFLSQFLQVKPNFYFESLPLRPLKRQFTQECKLSFVICKLFQNFVSFISWTQKMIFLWMLVSKPVATDFHSIYFFQTMEVSGYHQLLDYRHSSFVLNRGVQTCFCFVHPNLYIPLQ